MLHRLIYCFLSKLILSKINFVTNFILSKWAVNVQLFALFYHYISSDASFFPWFLYCLEISFFFVCEENWIGPAGVFTCFFETLCKLKYSFHQKSKLEMLESKVTSYAYGIDYITKRSIVSSDQIRTIGFLLNRNEIEKPLGSNIVTRFV